MSYGKCFFDFVQLTVVLLHMTDSGSDREDVRANKRGKVHVNEDPEVLPRRSCRRSVRKRKTFKASGSSSKPKAKKAKGAREAEQDESTIDRPNVNTLTKKEYEDLRWGTNPYEISRDQIGRAHV